MHAFLFLLTFLFTQSASAFKIQLIDSTLELDKGMNSTTATIVNDGERMIAIEASARVRSFNADGTENLETMADDLIIVPGQMIIHPNDQQVLNIRWVGPETIESEKAYRLLIEYVSISEDKLKGIKPDEKKAGVNINYRIAKAFYVKPRNTKPNIALMKVEKSNNNGAEVLKMTFSNIGTEHKLAYFLNVEFKTSTGETIPLTLTKSEIGRNTNFLAKSEQIIQVPMPDSLKGKDIVSAVLVGFDPPTEE